MLGELASIVPPSSLPITSSLTSDSSSKDDNSEPSNSIDRLALLRKRLEESAEPEELDSKTAAGENSLTLTVNSTAAALEDDETAATINILPPTPTVPSKPGGFEHHHSTSLSTEERTSSGSGSAKNSLSVEDALTSRRVLASDRDSAPALGKAVSESVTVPSSGSGGDGAGSHSNGSSTQGSPCFSPGAMHMTPDAKTKVQCMYSV